MTGSEEREEQPPNNPKGSLLQIYVLGPFDIQWPSMDMPFPKERLQGRGAAPALGLLKACLSQNDRFALRDWLMEQFWPESARSRADERLDDVASGLRGLLRPPRSTAKILHFVYGKGGKGNGYRLSDYPQIWVDADAFEYYVSQAARLDRFGQNSLSLWEHAYQLGSRGEFLPDERYSDWAQPRRERLQGQYRQCVHRVVQCLREIGAYEEALLRERRYWQGHKTDEDALRPLLEMLAERERYQEAEAYYEQAREAVKLEDGDLDEKTKDMMEYLRAQPIQRERAIQQAISATVSTNLVRITQEQGSRDLFSCLQGGPPRVLLPRSSVIPHTDGGTTNGLSPLLSQKYIFSSNEPANKMDTFNTSEQLKSGRTLAAAIAAMKESHNRLLLPLLSSEESFFVPSHAFQGRIGKALTNHSKVDDTTLTHFETITKNHWDLFLHAPSKRDLLGSFWGHWQTLLQFLRYPLPGAISNRLCSIAGESAQMIGEILFDIQDYQHAQNCYDFSIFAAKEAGNNVLRAVSLGRLSFLPIYQKEPRQAYPLLQEAKQLLMSVSSRPTLSAWLSLIEAEAVAHLRDEIACEKALEDATANYLQGISEEDRLWTRFNEATIPGYKGACYLELQKPQKALSALEETLNFIPAYSARHQSLILADMAAATQQMEEIQETCLLLRQALEITAQTKSLLVLIRIERVRKGLSPWEETTYVQQLDTFIGDIIPSIIV
jgi:DNA-binding SARP family transcriptional activator